MGCVFMFWRVIVSLSYIYVSKKLGLAKLSLKVSSSLRIMKVVDFYVQLGIFAAFSLNFREYLFSDDPSVFEPDIHGQVEIQISL